MLEETSLRRTRADVTLPCRPVLFLRPRAGWQPVLAVVCLVTACDTTYRPGDTPGVQSYGRWEWHGRVSAQPDPQVTRVRLTLDTTHGGGDVGLARYDFNPGAGEEATYALPLGLDFGRVRDLRQNISYGIGALPARIPPDATVTYFCPPLLPPSARRTLLLS